MSDPREALQDELEYRVRTAAALAKGGHSINDEVAAGKQRIDEILRENEMEWEYGVKWGDEPDDSRPALCGSREHAESRAAESHGDKIVRRAKARTIPAGPWEETP